MNTIARTHEISARRACVGRWSGVERARAAGIVALIVAASFGTSACGGDEQRVAASGDTSSPQAAAAAAPTDSLPPMPMQPGMTSALPTSPTDALGAFRLAGNEPFWAVRITADGLTYSSPDYEKGIHFAGVAPEQDGDKLRWVAITSTPDAHTLDVTIEEERCQDSMADKTWSHTAHVIFDGTKLDGCGERLSKTR